MHVIYFDTEIVISGGMSVPQILTTGDAHTKIASRIPTFATSQV
jgi:hypothetical protein